MNCINNISRTPIPSDVTMLSLQLYYQMGRNEVYQKLFSKDEVFLSLQLSYREAYAFYKCFFSELKIPESRLKTLQLDSTVANNKAEHLYKNILRIFRVIHDKDAQKFHLNTTEISDLAKILYVNYLSSDKLSFQKLERSKHSLLTSEITSKRELLEELIKKVDEMHKQKQFEPMMLDLNFIVDWLHMDIFKFEEQRPLATLILYILLLQENFIVTRYISFFEKLLLNIKEYQSLLDKTRFGWSEGFSEIMPLLRFMLKMYLSLYQQLYEQARDYEYENSLEISKSDYIENTIDKLNDVFSKEDIRLKHPLISDSTINRTLKRMQEENKIRPLGKGRSAKWIKLYQKEKKPKIQEQLNFDLE